ncbi:LCP family protein [Streptomyces sp. AK02-01A]|uniref:LCP family protein n=1 Tax=Streptomyces sp. AK02-01A TaxID=3028648 RepID=UPI0029AD7AB8|nr:LCP family protein [Streptomyces sp. AK02-01A]MDX3850342.1 LCP family protein [Streptomyces sp. AK02-01A]
MRQSSTHAEGTRRRVRHAGELGWDDSLYEGAEGGEAGEDGGDGEGGDRPPRGRDGRGGAPRARRGKRRILRWSATALAVLVLGTAGAGYLYYEHLNANIKKADLNLGDHKAAKPTPNAAGQTPLNILLVGSDARDSKENQALGGAKETFGAPPLADVQMLLHLSADRRNMSVVSIPRDTLMKIPKCTDPDTGKVYQATALPMMTNESLGRGGPGCTVAAWEELTGIHIDHFMLVDFAGVVSMADAIGGVPVCVDANVYSHSSDGKGSGLRLAKGTHPVKGEQALQWLRTRYGFEDNTDIGRTKAQHMYMNSMVRELRENATLGNPQKLRSLAEEATAALTVDPGLDTVKKLYDLSNELKKVPTERITMTTMPWQWAVSDRNRVEPKPEDAEKLFRLVREDIALDGKDKKKASGAEKTPDDPAAADEEIAVQVRNGTRTDSLAPVSSRASGVAQVLAGKGFTSATAEPGAASAQPKTVVRYPSADMEGDAWAVAKALGIPTSSVQRSTEVSGVTLVVGGDWREGDMYPKAKAEDDKIPESADALNGSNKKACMRVNPAFTW